jgi:hypothetical protein
MRQVRKLPLLLVVVLLVPAGCVTSRRSGTPLVRPGDKLTIAGIVLRALPAQGLVVDRKGGLTLLDLKGTELDRLPGYHLFPHAGGTHDLLIQNLDLAGPPRRIRIVGPDDAWYELSVRPGHLALLEKLERPRVTVASALLIAHGGVDGDSVGFEGFTLRRRGSVLARRDRNLKLVAGRYAQTRGRLVDLATGERWRVPARCLAARDGVAFALCKRGPRTTQTGYPAVALVRIDRDGSVRRVGAFPPLDPVDAALSPDGRYVGANAAYACGGAYSLLAPTTGGPARLVSGGAWTPQAPFSHLLGWSADGRAVAYIQTPDCEHTPQTGTYLVDPATLKRTLVTRSYSTLWNAFPGR